MSGLPNPPQAQELGDALREIGRLGPRIDACRVRSANLAREAEALAERRGELWRRAEQLLEVMDCASAGHFGHERRMFALLTMLVGSGARSADDVDPIVDAAFAPPPDEAKP